MAIQDQTLITGGYRRWETRDEPQTVQRYIIRTSIGLAGLLLLAALLLLALGSTREERLALWTLGLTLLGMSCMAGVVAVIAFSNLISMRQAIEAQRLQISIAADFAAHIAALELANRDLAEHVERLARLLARLGATDDLARRRNGSR